MQKCETQITMVADYYSQEVSNLDDEEEILESLPVSNASNAGGVDENIDSTNQDIVIEQDNIPKLKNLNDDFQLKIKNKMLYSRASGFHTRDKDQENIRANRLLRFTFLENELRALMLDIEQDSNESQSELRTKIDMLVNDIDTFKLRNGNDTFMTYWNNKLASMSLAAPSEMTHTTPAEHTSLGPELAVQKLYTNLESRISTLEDKIGLKVVENSQSVQDSIDDLYTRVNLLLNGNENIREINDEIVKLIDNCELYLKNSRNVKDLSEIVPLTDKKLCYLYDRMKKLPDFEILLDKIIKRFKSLNELILQTSNTVRFMNDLESELSNMDSKLNSWNERLDHFESQLQADREALNSSVQLLKDVQKT